MSFSSTVTVKFGDKAGLVDVSNRATGAQCKLRLDVGQFGTHRASVTLLNNDGELTPGGDGTYADVDWLSQALFITGDTGSYTYDVFHGIVTDFKIVDDGINSTVVLEADDGFTVGGGSATEIDINSGNILGGPPNYWIAILYNGYSTVVGDVTGVQMPLLANTDAETVATPINIDFGAPGQSLAIRGPFTTTAPVRDLVSVSVMPAGPNVAWPTTIDLTTSTTTYTCLTSNIYPVRSSATYDEFEFDEAAAAGELPFRKLQRGFPIDSMLNTAVMSSLPGYNALSVSATSIDTTSTEKYGVRAVQADQVMIGTGTSTAPLSMQTIADRWAHTYAGADFTVDMFEITESLVNATVGSSATSEEKWAQLLDITDGPLQVSNIRFTPVGSSTQLEETFVTLGRTIQIAPADIRITLECLPIDRTGVFVLDSDVLGVLDQNRLG